MSDFDYDVLVIGSGFGGSVTALRLTEKGYKVGVLEAGARFTDADFADNSWDLKKYLFAPSAGCYGIQRIDMVKDCLILAGAGVGGGSLVYANTLYEALDPFYTDPSWAHITDWKAELAPYYDQAKRMLGVVTYPRMTPSDEVMKKVADEMGVGDSFHATPVGVFFGGPAQSAGDSVEDPYFGGVGPRRNTCTDCGECMTGCRHNAKNTLVKNYLYLAEQNGAEVHPLTTVTRVRPLAGGGYRVDTRWSKAKLSRRTAVRTFTAEQVVFSAAALGTQKLLHRLKATGDLPNVSDRLGHLTRTNSESILGAIAPEGAAVDYTEGVAITSSWHPDEHTHIEPVRYGKGSNAMSLMQTVLTDGDGPEARWKVWLKELWKERKRVRDLYDVKHWSERVVIALVMQSVDNSITTFPKRVAGKWVLSSKQGHGEPNPTWIPAANDAVRRMAAVMGGGTAGGTIGEPFNRPLTAHFIGGCTIGDSPASGVVDGYQRMYGHPGLHIVDGSTISANLGVNPSLTITAQAERAMAYWPNKGETDTRPALGEAYASIEPVAPRAPVVPDDAPAALRLPIVGVS
ncbi:MULTISPECIES: GMC oxidoreductase [unclassified Nocardioides]|uniref:GMC oxidoreductase n=1 Tax=unclassified Nocardioides TaxID=2615069 RepID=UPI0011522F7D|nr:MULTISPECIES: GMC family oxidoreductase [unclassified Nocardioides]TQK72632.1 cholesterol oxidase [Nocardioides sp. SLBN-35]WGY03164.1 GMC family oxidoreductase [Nocardioides sp. QY071]